MNDPMKIITGDSFEARVSARKEFAIGEYEELTQPTSFAGKTMKGNKRKEAQIRRRRGEIYYTKNVNNVTVQRRAREMGLRCHHFEKRNGCTTECYRIDDSDRKTIFNEIWKMDWQQRKMYVSEMVRVMQKKRCTKKDGGISRRSKTYLYHLRCRQEYIKVCKKFFISTTGLGEWSIASWASNSVELPETVDDAKDQNVCHKKNDITVAQFLDGLSDFESNNFSIDTAKFYLEPVLNMFSELYQAYLNLCQENQREPCSPTMLQNIIMEKNLAFLNTHKDQGEMFIQDESGNVVKKDKHTRLKEESYKKL